MSEQTIYRVASRDVPFAQIANAMLRDKRLSIEARGTLALILTYPADWTVAPEWLADAACMGRDKARKVLKELVKYGYCARSQSRETRAKFSTSVYLFTDMAGGLPNVSQGGPPPCPENPSTVPPQTEPPQTALPSPVDQSHTNTRVETNTVSEEYTPLPPKGGGPTPHDALIAFEAYNATAMRCGLPQASQFTPDRKRKIIAKLKLYGLDGWYRAMANLEKSAMCQGQNDRGWRASLEFVLQTKSFNNLHDGAYGNGAHSAGPTPAKSKTMEIIERGIAAERAAENERALQ